MKRREGKPTLHGQSFTTIGITGNRKLVFVTGVSLEVGDCQFYGSDGFSEGRTGGQIAESEFAPGQAQQAYVPRPRFGCVSQFWGGSGREHGKEVRDVHRIILLYLDAQKRSRKPDFLEDPGMRKKRCELEIRRKLIPGGERRAVFIFYRESPH